MSPTTTFGTERVAKYRKLFESVQNQDDWRAPINCLVPLDTDRQALSEAIQFYTSTLPTFEIEGSSFRVKADGYRAGPAGP